MTAGGAWWRGCLVAAAGLLVAGDGEADSMSPQTRSLPAYSHNDYKQSRPLEAALGLSCEGVEVDLHYVRGRLLVGHDLEETRPEGTFDAMYLRPLESHAVRRDLPGSRPFWLFVDLKTEGMAAYRALRAALEARSWFLTEVRAGVESPGQARVVLVGWCPPLDSLRAEETRYVSVHRPLAELTPEDLLAPSHLVRLVSLDASKLPRWVPGLRTTTPVRGALGEGQAPPAWNRAFERLRAAREAGKVTRVHHLRVNARLYDYALRQGVDLIGTQELAESARLLNAYRNSASP